VPGAVRLNRSGWIETHDRKPDPDHRHCCPAGDLRDHPARGGTRLCRPPFRRSDGLAAGADQPESAAPHRSVRHHPDSHRHPALFGWYLPFGYAKPVPVDFSRLRNPKQDMFWVAAAGPGANLFMAFCWALLAQAGLADAGQRFHAAAVRDEQDRHHGQLRADGAQSLAAAAARWWAHRRQPAAAQSGLEIRPDRALGFPDFAAPAIHRYPRRRHEPAGHLSARAIESIFGLY
jgi:hypothetical protein